MVPENEHPGVVGGERLGVGPSFDRAPAEGSRLLLVEDDDELRALLARSLRRAGFVVAEAATGPDFLRRLEACIFDRPEEDPPGDLDAASPYDAIVSDVDLPGLSGLDVLRLDRILNAVGPRPPVVMITGLADEESLSECAGLGVAAVLEKPVSAGGLLKAVRRALAGAGKTCFPAAAG